MNKIFKSFEVLKKSAYTKSFLEHLSILKVMLAQLIQGQFRIFRWKTYTKFFFAFAYFIMPADLLPDFIPFLGQLDDLTVFLWFLNDLKKDIDSFKNTKEKQ